MKLELNIHKDYPGFTLDMNLSTSARRVGILGASGSGKSMLLKCLCGLITPDSGFIQLGDRVLFDSQKKINLPPRQRRVGFLFQNYALFPHLTVLQNITFGLDDLPPQQRQETAESLMARFHLAELAGRYPGQLSGGQQQRVALARAMAPDPDILFLDEPFSALDEHLRSHMIKAMLEDLKDYRGTVLLVTHNIEEVYRLCDHLVIISGGSINATGPKEKLFQHPVTMEGARVTGCKNLAPAFLKSNGVLDIPKWGIFATSAELPSKAAGWAGIRANHILLADEKHQENLFSAWIAERSEAPFRITLYLKLNQPAEHPGDFDVQWEISRDAWHTVRELPQPLTVSFPARHMMFLNP